MGYQINYGLKGTERKALVDALSKSLDMPATYLKAPSFRYEIGEYIVDKNGTVICPNDDTESDVELITETLMELGFTPVAVQHSEASEGESLDDVVDTVTIAIPSDLMDTQSLIRLENLIESKQTILKHALGIENLEIKYEDDKILFPWCNKTDPDWIHAVTQLVCAMTEMARRQTRIDATEKPVDNEKFAMRIFMVRLEMKGPEFKTARKLLMENLTGNSAWPTAKPVNKTIDENMAMLIGSAEVKFDKAEAVAPETAEEPAADAEPEAEAKTPDSGEISPNTADMEAAETVEAETADLLEESENENTTESETSDKDE